MSTGVFLSLSGIPVCPLVCSSPCLVSQYVYRCVPFPVWYPSMSTGVFLSLSGIPVCPQVCSFPCLVSQYVHGCFPLCMVSQYIHGCVSLPFWYPIMSMSGFISVWKASFFWILSKSCLDPPSLLDNLEVTLVSTHFGQL